MADSTQVSNTHVENQDSVGIILAAGMGKRMKTSLPKVAHAALGKPLVLWAVDAFVDAGLRNLVVVLSPKQAVVEELVRAHASVRGISLSVAFQDSAQGTAHAARCGLPQARALLAEAGVPPEKAQLVIGFGDTPAVGPEAFARYLAFHRAERACVTLLAFEPADNSGYGRILTDARGAFTAIREEKDCGVEEKRVRLCNSGFLCARFSDFEDLVARVGNQNAAQEYYLTDVPFLARAEGKPVSIFSGIPERELAGVNSQEQLAEAAQFLQRRIIRGWQARGVQFLDPSQVYVEESVTFEPDVIVEPFVYLAGKSHFASGSRVPAFSRIIDGKKGN